MKLRRIIKLKSLLLAALVTVTMMLSAGTAQAALSFGDTHNFSGDGSLDDRDYIELSGGNGNPFVFSYNHNVTFIPPAASISSAQVVLSHHGNSNNNGEVWFLEGANKTFIGKLDNSTQGNNWVDQTFVLPTSLYAAINGSSWSLQLVLNETTSGTDKLQIDQSVLSGSYVPTPIPAAAWLFGSGLMGLIGIRRNKDLSVMRFPHEW